MKSAFFAVNKPSGISSAAVVSKIKNILKQTGENVKVGNMGTLDVDASGLLVIAVNKATRLFEHFSKLLKTYQTTIKFGVETDTLDSTGKVLTTSKKLLNKNQILETLPKLIGEIKQVPPKYSAKHINGQRAYDLMRNGEAINFEIKPKIIKIYDISLLNQIAEDEWKFEITCGTGTYIRAIARDIAAYNTTYGITTSIIRTKTGIFNLANALEFSELNYNKIINSLVNVNNVIPYKTIVLTEEGNRTLLDGKQLNAYLTDGYYFTNVNNEITTLSKCQNGKLKIEINLSNI